ncbi:hypothetical protein SDC49_11780 [Lactobacillus sp. R2/2]|nr:hypothetical protein [Lactobacillus sp. R2/2]
MIKNSEDKWLGKWISSDFAYVSKEPEFSLADMFGGKRHQFPSLLLNDYMRQ